MRQSISNFWHRRLGGLCPGVSRPVTVKFHLILCCFRCPFPAFNDCFMFSTFFTISASFRFVPQVPHFSRFFFHPSLLLVAACACFCAVTEDGHCLKSRGVDYPLDSPTPVSRTLVHPALSPLPPRFVPSFKRPPTVPPPFHTIPQFAHSPNLALSQEDQYVAFLKERM